MKYENSFIRRWYQRVWNENNIGAIDEMMHPECIAHGLGEQPLVGIKGFRDSFTYFKTLFPELTVTVDAVHIDGEMQVARCTVNGKDVNGKPVSFGGTSIAKVVDDQIVEGWNYFDFLSMYMQLGTIKQVEAELAQ